ncbi:MAG: thioredoxin family protein [Rhodospirillales bacterium]|nr:thioredoxin family protein [Rhodospirillales bacterium]
MALMETPICNFGWPAVDFKLKGIDGSSYTLDSVKGPNGLLIMFICNHCPYVKAIAERLPDTVSRLKDMDIGVIAINSNDTTQYPADSFDNMKLFAEQHSFNFPYLIEDTQEIARAYDAICTPDFFGFNKNLELQYRGRLDSAGINAVSETTSPDLLNAMKMVAETGNGPKEQIPSMGCSIKWQ